jgi:hypothetical protein
MSHSGIRLSNRLTGLTEPEVQRMAEIAANYIPDKQVVEELLGKHLRDAHAVRLAILDDDVVGFSIASKYRLQTPFYPRPINVLYQRMLYLDPSILYRGLGLRLLAVTLRDLFGFLWPFTRFAAFCRTATPIVAKYMHMYSLAYPQLGKPIPEAIQVFGEDLLPLLDSDSLDEEFRLLGPLKAMVGVDYTETWNRFYRHDNSHYEQLMLNSAFEEKDGRVISKGAFILMIAYAKPLNFVRYLFH